MPASEDPPQYNKTWPNALPIRACSHVCRFCTCADLAHISPTSVLEEPRTFNHRFDSERKILQPSFGFRIRSRCTIGGCCSWSRRKRKPHSLDWHTALHEKNLHCRVIEPRTQRSEQEAALVHSNPVRTAVQNCLGSLTTFVIPEGLPIKPLMTLILAGGTDLPATIASAIPRNTWRSARAFL